MMVQAEGYKRGDYCTLMELSRVKQANILFCERSSEQDIQILQIQFAFIIVIMDPLQTTIPRSSTLSQNCTKIKEEEPIQLNIKILISQKSFGLPLNQPIFDSIPSSKKYNLEIDARKRVQSTCSRQANAFRTPVRSSSYSKVSQIRSISGTKVDSCFCTICESHVSRDEYNQHLIVHRTRLRKREGDSKIKDINKIMSSNQNDEEFKKIVISPKQYHIDFDYDKPIHFRSSQNDKKPFINEVTSPHQNFGQKLNSHAQNVVYNTNSFQRIPAQQQTHKKAQFTDQIIPQLAQSSTKSQKHNNIHQLPTNKLNKILSSSKKQPLDIKFEKNQIIQQAEEERKSNFSSKNQHNLQSQFKNSDKKREQQSIHLQSSEMSLQDELKNKKYVYKRNFNQIEISDMKNEMKKRSESLKSFKSFVSIHSGLSEKNIEYVDKVLETLKNSSHKKSQISQKRMKQDIINSELMRKQSPSERKKKLPKNMLAVTSQINKF